MKTLQQLKADKEQKVNDLLEECQVFWAFSEKTLKEGIEKLKPNWKVIVSIGAGGYMPKYNVDKFHGGISEITKDFNKQVKEMRLKREHILYELKNHEAFYTGRISETLEALNSSSDNTYPEDEVMEVFLKHKKFESNG